MDDEVAELERLCGSDRVCGLCGDTGLIWGREEYGPCPCEQQEVEETPPWLW